MRRPPARHLSYGVPPQGSCVPPRTAALALPPAQSHSAPPRICPSPAPASAQGTAPGVGGGVRGACVPNLPPAHLECERAAVVESLGIVRRELYGPVVVLHRLTVEHLLAQAVAAVGVRLTADLVERQRMIEVGQCLQAYTCGI